ncbi:MAG TPA: DegV family protein [Acidimicrobiales bacterium]|nr:DegV family protein [Acidimicrobiales bacterium]
MAVAVVSDSAAALPPELAQRLGVTVVPMRLSIGEETYEGGAIPLEEVVRRFDEGVHTSGPAPAGFSRAIEEADQGEGVVVLTVSQRMSSTHRSAELAAELHGDSVRVVDSWSAAGGQALVVLATACVASEGGSLADVVGRAEEVRAQVRLVAAVDTLDYLVKGGRLPDLAGKAGRYFGVRPLFEFRTGRIRPLRPSLSRDGALDALLSHWRRSQDGTRPLHVVVSHALAPEAADHLVTAIRAEVEPATCLVESFSPVMVAHTGPGVTGLAWWWG